MFLEFRGHIGINYIKHNINKLKIEAKAIILRFSTTYTYYNIPWTPLLAITASDCVVAFLNMK